MNSVAPRLRPMTIADLPPVLQLDRSSHFSPWSEGNFRDALAAGNLCVVGEQARQLVACAVLQMAAGDAELLTMAVSPAVRRQGIGRWLLQEVIALGAQYKATAIWLEVRPSNAAALALYRQAGFAELGRRKDYYQTPEGREDALMMRLALTLFRNED